DPRKGPHLFLLPQRRHGRGPTHPGPDDRIDRPNAQGKPPLYLSPWPAHLDGHPAFRTLPEVRPALMAPAARFPILVGPTGVGKSEGAMELARRLKAEIISADAFQAYRGLPIGTAQPSPEYQREIPHHLVGCLGLGEKWDAAEFAKRAASILKDLREKG